MNANEARWRLKRYLEEVECGHKRYDPAVVKEFYREVAHFKRKKRRRREHSPVPCPLRPWWEWETWNPWKNRVPVVTCCTTRETVEISAWRVLSKIIERRLRSE